MKMMEKCLQSFLFVTVSSISLSAAYPIEPGAILPASSVGIAALGIIFLITALIFVLSCACCRAQRQGFKPKDEEFGELEQFRDHIGGSVRNLSFTNTLSELNIFPPPGVNEISNNSGNNSSYVSPQVEQCRSAVVEDERTTRPAGFASARVNIDDWFADPKIYFPRQQLFYQRELGKGWFGKVVEGEARGAKVVVRILREDATPQEKAYFLHEAKPYRNLRHRNVARLWGRCLEMDPYLLLFHYYSNGDLKSFLVSNASSKNVLNEQGICLRIMTDVTEGLSYMLANEFIHTDLAARNCLVSSDLTVKIGDYGTNIDVYKDEYYITENVAIPLRWCAPESLHCTPTTIEAKQVTESANVWSLAVLLWEIAEFGLLPYSDLTDDQVIIRVFGSEKLRLPQPDCIYGHYLYNVMQLCWRTTDRASIWQVSSMLNYLRSNPIQENDFDARWRAMKPNTIPKVDNHTPMHSPRHTELAQRPRLLTKSEFDSGVDLEMKTDENIDSSCKSTTPLTVSPQLSVTSDELFRETSTCVKKSPSLTNFQGSLEDVSTTQLDSWLQGVEQKTEEDRTFVRNVSEAIRDLDQALELEKTSSSDDGSEEDTTNKQLVPHFRLGPLSVKKVNDESSSDTEDETWRRRIERGEFTEKVKEKSKSVTDLMILTHIDSESSENDSLPSLTRQCSIKNKNLNKPTFTSVGFGSEGNIRNAVLSEELQDKLKKLSLWKTADDPFLGIAASEKQPNLINNLFNFKKYINKVPSQDNVPEIINKKICKNEGETSVILGSCEDYTLDYFKGLKTTYAPNDSFSDEEDSIDSHKSPCNVTDESTTFDDSPNDISKIMFTVTDNKIDKNNVDFVNFTEVNLKETVNCFIEEEKRLCYIDNNCTPEFKLDDLVSKNVFPKFITYDVYSSIDSGQSSDYRSHQDNQINDLKRRLEDVMKLNEEFCLKKTDDEYGTKVLTPDDERSSDSGFRDKGSLSESAEDTCDEKYNLEDIDAELDESFDNFDKNKLEEWFLHPKPRSPPLNQENGWTPESIEGEIREVLNVDPDFINALRNELKDKLPHLQDDKEEVVVEEYEIEKPEIYFNYPTQLSPIYEEQESNDSSIIENICSVFHLDSSSNANICQITSDDIFETEEDVLIVDTETNEATLIESPKAHNHIKFFSPNSNIYEDDCSTMSPDNFPVTPDISLGTNTLSSPEQGNFSGLSPSSIKSDLFDSGPPSLPYDCANHDDVVYEKIKRTKTYEDSLEDKCFNNSENQEELNSTKDSFCFEDEDEIYLDNNQSFLGFRDCLELALQRVPAVVESINNISNNTVTDYREKMSSDLRYEEYPNKSSCISIHPVDKIENSLKESSDESSSRDEDLTTVQEQKECIHNKSDNLDDITNDDVIDIKDVHIYLMENSSFEIESPTASEFTDSQCNELDLDNQLMLTKNEISTIHEQENLINEKSNYVINETNNVRELDSCKNSEVIVIDKIDIPRIIEITHKNLTDESMQVTEVVKEETQEIEQNTQIVSEDFEIDKKGIIDDLSKLLVTESVCSSNNNLLTDAHVENDRVSSNSTHVIDNPESKQIDQFVSDINEDSDENICQGLFISNDSISINGASKLSCDDESSNSTEESYSIESIDDEFDQKILDKVLAIFSVKSDDQVDCVESNEIVEEKFNELKPKNTQVELNSSTNNVDVSHLANVNTEMINSESYLSIINEDTVNKIQTENVPISLSEITLEIIEYEKDDNIEKNNRSFKKSGSMIIENKICEKQNNDKLLNKSFSMNDLKSTVDIVSSNCRSNQILWLKDLLNTDKTLLNKDLKDNLEWPQANELVVDNTKLSVSSTLALISPDGNGSIVSSLPLTPCSPEEKTFSDRNDADNIVTQEKEIVLPRLDSGTSSSEGVSPSPEDANKDWIPTIDQLMDLAEGEEMTTSFIEPDENGRFTPDWESDSSESSSSSGEFIWKDGDKEGTIKPLIASPDEPNFVEESSKEIKDKFDGNKLEEKGRDEDEIECTDDSSSEDSGSEFVPSTWDSMAVPKKSALKSINSLSSSPAKRKVIFKKEKYQCIYEYPREPSDDDDDDDDDESGIRCDVTAWQTPCFTPPQSSLSFDYSAFTDWDMGDTDGPITIDIDSDTEDDNQIKDNKKNFDFYKLDYMASSTAVEDGEFYSSSDIRGQSQFFPGANQNLLIDIDKDSQDDLSDRDTYTPCSEYDESSSINSTPLTINDMDNLFVHTTKENLGQLRHTKNRLKLDFSQTPVSTVNNNNNNNNNNTSLGELRHTKDQLKLDLKSSSMKSIEKGEATLLDSGIDTCSA